MRLRPNGWRDLIHKLPRVSTTLESIRAMTLYRLGRIAEARQSLTHAYTLIGQHPFRDLEGASYELHDWIRANILFREAAGLLGQPG